jgi:hypothetical protein
MKKLTFDKNDFLKIGEQPLSGTFFVNWIKILIENKFNIDWRYLPKALYVTIMILIMTPFRIFEKNSFDKIKNDIKVKSPIFIIGHWRSGTTFLHYLMGQDKNLAYVSTFETMTPNMMIKKEELFKNIVKNHLPNKRPMDNLELHADLPYEEEYAIANLSPYSFYHAWYFPKKMRKYFDQNVLYKNNSNGIKEKWIETYDYFLKKITYKNNGNQIVLKSLVNTAKIPIILKKYPNAKFIFMYRNPYKVYLSTWNLYRKILPIFSFQKLNNYQLDNEILYNYRNLITKYLKDKKFIPHGNLIEISYEDFVKNPFEMLKRIYIKLGLDSFEKSKTAFEKYILKHKNYKTNNYTIDNKIKDKIYNEWNFAFKEFGYTK